MTLGSRAFYDFGEKAPSKSSENNFDEICQLIRENIIGQNQTFTGPFGTRKIVYCDYVASGGLGYFCQKSFQNMFWQISTPAVKNIFLFDNFPSVAVNFFWQFSHAAFSPKMKQFYFDNFTFW